MQNIKILFRNSYEVQEEFDWLKQNIPNHLLEYRSQIQPNTLIIPRYSALPFYKELETEVKLLGSKLINTFKQHRFVADLQKYYPILKDFTPRTWFQGQFPEIPLHKQYVVKGLTNSRKFDWNRLMFANNRDEAFAIYEQLLYDSLIKEQGICIREYIPLKQVDTGINGLPISIEFRFFCYKESILSSGWY